MSLWGATVITNLMSAIPWVGQDIVEFLWGGFSVNNATLNRFFALHYVLPFVLAALALMHLIALHDSAGSGNPLGVSGNCDRLPFAPYFIFKDLITIFLFILILSVFVFFMPNVLGDSENYVMANPMQTPPAIVPEWYLLPFYAILRSIPNKLLGVIAMFLAILILLAMPFTDLSRSRGIQFRPFSKIAFFIFVANFLILMQLGAKHVESPFIEFGQVSTVIFFSYFLIIVPLLSLFENSLLELSSYKYNTIDTYTEITGNNLIAPLFIYLYYYKVLFWLKDNAFLYSLLFIYFLYFIRIIFIILIYFGYLDYPYGFAIDYCVSDTDDDEREVVWPYKKKYSQYTLDQLKEVRDDILKEYNYVSGKLNFFREKYIRSRDFEYLYSSLPARGFNPPNIDNLITEFRDKRIDCENELKAWHLQEEKLFQKVYAANDRLKEIYKKYPQLEPSIPVRTPKRPWELN